MKVFERPSRPATCRSPHAAPALLGVPGFTAVSKFGIRVSKSGTGREPGRRSLGSSGEGRDHRSHPSRLGLSLGSRIRRRPGFTTVSKFGMSGTRGHFFLVFLESFVCSKTDGLAQCLAASSRHWVENEGLGNAHPASHLTLTSRRSGAAGRAPNTAGGAETARSMRH